MKFKVCGMKHNAEEVAELQPDYIGFIFYDKSSRYIDGSIPELNDDVKKVGVYVDASLEAIHNDVNTYGLEAVQLHGEESTEYCKLLKDTLPNTEIIKAFAIDDSFQFKQLVAYEKYCDYYLFDTKGKLPGGNGYAFDWTLLKNYKLTKPYFLSGGIGLSEVDKIKSFFKTDVAQYCYAIDVNSRFEIEPGLKNIDDLKTFKSELYEL